MASSSQRCCEEQFLCSICLEVFSDPVSTPCGHNFCKICLSEAWDSSARCKCPLCNRSFSSRPELFVNTLLSEMVAQSKAQPKLKSTHGGVSCDICSEPKLKAMKSCLVCESSFCEEHLQPHLSVPRLKKHQLMEPVEDLEDRLCPTHQRPLELFCNTDNKAICVMCSVLEHKSHDYVSLKEASEQQKIRLKKTVAENQDLVEQRRLKVQKILHCLDLSEKEKQREEAAGLQAFSALIQSVTNQREQFLKQLQEKQKSNQRQAEDLLHQLQEEMDELEKNSSEAQQRSLSPDPLSCLRGSSVLPPAGLKDWSCLDFEPQSCEGSMLQALSAVKERLDEEINKVLKEQPKKVVLRRLQRFAVDITLDPDTAYPYLALSEDLKQVHHSNVWKILPESPKRFSNYANVLGKQGFSSGRFYFEVQTSGKTDWTLGVVQESVNRKENITLCPENGIWSIILRDTDTYTACAEHSIQLSPQRPPQKIGVFVDYGAAVVSFYDVASADLLYSFTDCRFKGKLFPYLNPCLNKGGGNSAPLIISAVDTDDGGQ